MILKAFISNKWRLGHHWVANLLTVALLLVSGIGHANQDTKTESIDLTSTDRLIHSLISKLPESDFKRGVSRYLGALGLKYYEGQTAGHSNAGLNVYLSQKMNQNPCFGALANQFYSDITAQDRNFMKSFGIRLSQTESLPRPTLNDQSGKKPYDTLRPGWLWDKALYYTSGDANLALSLIGVCGHDDVNQGPYDFMDRSEFGRKIILRDGENLPTDYRKTALEKGFFNNVECPEQSSTMFLSKSIGTVYDLAPEVKKEIVKTQTGSSNLKALPSKDYHIYGAAFASCLLIQEGVPTLIASRIQKEAARAYRGIRQCENINTPLAVFDRIHESYKTELREKGLRPIQLDFETFIYKKAQEISKTPSCIGPYHLRPEICDFFKPMIGGYEFLHEVKQRMSVHEFITQITAANLYRQWFLGKATVFGVEIPCANINFFGPKNILPQKNEHPRLSMMCGPQTSAITCQAARKKIARWLSDFDWSIKQHAIGAEFATRFCQKEKFISENVRSQPYERACGPLQTAPQIFPEKLMDE